MIPFIPSELVTIIFEHLYGSLCYVPGRGMYDTPTGAGFVFSRLSLVSKTWHSLALSFLVRNFDNFGSPTAIMSYLKMLQKYRLARRVETISLGFTGKTTSSTSATELLEELNTIWNPRRVALQCQEPAKMRMEDVLNVFPFIQKTSSLTLSRFASVYPIEWTHQLPHSLTFFDFYSDDIIGPFSHSQTDSLAIAIARRNSQTLVTLGIRSMRPYWGTSSTEAFGHTSFPSLKSLYIDAFLCNDFDLRTHFPRLQSASLSLYQRTLLLKLPVLPCSLQHLVFLNITEHVLERIADNLLDLLNQAKSLKLFEICTYVQEWGEWENPFAVGEELEEHRHFVEIANLCQFVGVQFKCYEWDQIFRVLDKKLSKLPSRSKKEEEDLDYDAEDGEEFRHLWSREKLAELEAGELILRFLLTFIISLTSSSLNRRNYTFAKGED
jgi:hypothetical protein